MQRGSCVKAAEGECVVPISDKKLPEMPDLVEPKFDEPKAMETGIILLENQVAAEFFLVSTVKS